MYQSSKEYQINNKTSCNLIDAALYLLGYSQHQVQIKWYENPDDPSGETDQYVDHVEDMITDLDVAKGNYAEARHDNKPQETIDALLAERNRLQEKVDKFNNYKNLITDELAKPNSALRIDRHFNENKDESHITLLSLIAWAKSTLGLDILIELTLPKESIELKAVQSNKPRSKMQDQKNAILAAIEELGHDPKNLPRNISGKAGIKSKVKNKLAANSLFTGATVFDKTWESLRAGGKINNI